MWFLEVPADLAFRLGEVCCKEGGDMFNYRSQSIRELKAHLAMRRNLFFPKMEFSLCFPINYLPTVVLGTILKKISQQ